jgi:hypothetical protein
MKRVPNGMASQNDIVRLLIQVEKLDKNGLHLLMGMPSLTHLQLTVWDHGDYGDPSFVGGWSFDPVTVGSDGFKLLKVFCFTFRRYEGTGIAFAPGSMPALGRLHLSWEARDVMSGCGADMGIQHLSGLAHLEVVTNCYRVTVANVEGVEGSLEKAIALHPNRQNLQVRLHREDDTRIFKDEEDWKEARHQYFRSQAQSMQAIWNRL